MFKKFALFLLIAVSIFSLAACRRTTEPDPNGEMTVQEKLEDAAGRVLFVDTGAVTRNLNFPTALVHGVSVSWSSGNTAVISNTGQVTRPTADDGDVTVTVTATFSLDGESITRTYTFTVTAMPESTQLSIEDALKEGTGAVVTVRGIVTHLYSGNNRASIQDETGAIFLFGVAGFSMNIGDEIEVTGSRRTFNGLEQLDPIASIDVISTGNELPASEMIDFTVSDFMIYQNKRVSAENVFIKETPNITGTGGVNFTLIDEDGNDLMLLRIESESNLGKDNRDAIVALINTAQAGDGLVITGALMGWFNEPQILITHVNQLEIVTGDLTDAEKLSRDINALDTFAPNYTFGDNITLPTTGANGTAFTNWTSSHPDLIANDGTFVAAPSEFTVVTFTATATIGSETGTATIKIDALAPMDISDAIEADAGRHVYVQGIVTYVVQGNRGFFIYDGTGHIYIRDTNLVPASGEVPYKVGDIAKFIGARDNFSGIPQVTAIKLHETTTGDYTAPGSIGPVSIESIGEGVHPAGTTVTITGVATTVVDGNFTNYRIVDGDHFVQVHHNTNNVVFADFDGQQVTVEVFVFQWAHANKFVGFFGTADDVTVGELSDQEKADLAAAAIDLGDLSAIFDNISLPTTGQHGSTISWSSSHPDVISNTGVVTRQEDEVVVTLTATVTVGEETATRNFEVTVLDEDYVPTGMSVSEALEAEVGTIIYVEGVVSSYSPFSKRIFIQDADGTAIYVNVQLSDHVSIGDKVVLRGTLQNYTSFNNDFLQLGSDTTLVFNYEGDHAVTVITDATWTEIYDAHVAFENVGVRYRMENVAIEKFDGSWIYLTTGEDMDLRFNVGSYGGHLSALYEAGETIPWVEFTVYDLYQGDIRIEAVVFPDLTDAQVQTLADARLSLPATTETDLTLPATLSIAGVDYDRGPDVFALVWTSANTDVITDAGVVTRPEIGEPDVEVQMTATITFADESTYAVNFMVTVKAEEEVIPSTWDYEEDFSFVETATTSYSTSLQHTDANGFEWDLLGRANVGSWMLGNAADGSYIEITATGGISSISIDMVRAFTNTNVRTAELFVNDVSYGTFTIDPESNDPQTFLVEDIDVEGPVVIKLVTTSPGSRGAFNVLSISWNGYEDTIE